MTRLPQRWAHLAGVGARVGRTPVSGTRHRLPCPATGDTLAETAWVEAPTARSAVSAAAEAFDGWRATSPELRSGALRAIAADLRREAEELALLITAESGKRLAEARAEVELSARYFDWYAGLSSQVAAPEVRAADGRRTTVTHQPVGVVAAVSPWNFPLSIPARKVAPALAAGCTVVQKASEVTPLSSLALTELCEPHLPPGALGVLVGDGAVLTTALIDAEAVAAVTFTGSTRIGTEVAVRAATSLTRTTLELGGRSPFIVTERADPQAALEVLLVAKFRNNGASCIAANNVFVHESLADDFLAVLEQRIRRLIVGDPTDPTVDLGPLVSAEHVARVEALVAAAEADGCAVMRGGRPDGTLAEGFFLPPTLVEATAPTRLWHEEVFGPVCQVQRYSCEDAVVAAVNGWRTGLGGYIASQDVEHAARLAARLRIGIIGVNTGTPNSPDVPFGGFDRAGLGREGGLSGLRAFQEEQTVATGH